MKSEMVRARVSPEEIADYTDVAGHEPLSAWVRRMLNEAVRRQRQGEPAEAPEVKVKEAVEAGLIPAEEPPADPPRRCEQWRNHRAGRFCKTCGETMPA